MKKQALKSNEQKLSKLLLVMLIISGLFVLQTIISSLIGLRLHWPGTYWGLIQGINGLFLFGIWKRRKDAVIAFLVWSAFIIFRSSVFYVAMYKSFISYDINTPYIIFFPLLSIVFVFLWIEALKRNWYLFK